MKPTGEMLLQSPSLVPMVLRTLLEARGGSFDLEKRFRDFLLLKILFLVNFIVNKVIRMDPFPCYAKVRLTDLLIKIFRFYSYT